MLLDCIIPILFFLSFATAQAPPIPPPGLFCCPPCGPNGLHLDRQQVGPYTIFCYYSPGTDLGCFYDPGTGAGATTVPGCPTQAPSNPHPPTCPI
ncbi:hypothetical protein M413DRAFT_448034 [Hebeloma cylindrosporum]|uniref:Secreted protein n=1 Tax=Hebeloma cylindrosporum TaxID=76867 RepID=A0A0C3C140_HEBCY|nr:hypothetical protein M413DRAFT_448034 [Hebeloma cylindrosporum h7]